METKREVRGIVEFDERGGAFLRRPLDLDRYPDDPLVRPDILRRHKLREGCEVAGTVVLNQKRQPVVDAVHSVNGLPVTEWLAVEEFSRRIAVDPFERLKLSPGRGESAMRVVDLLCPIGKGQRALIVSPPKAGKTMLLQQYAQAIRKYNPSVELIVLLIDERPEEVTDMRRTLDAEVYASSSDSDRQLHTRLARLALEYAKRKVETGKDVVILLDSLTRLGRAFNASQRSSGRTMSGGVDIRALEIPKRIFGAARALEGGGSLTIIATVLIETNSRMDELIFQEFKGTGNMELVLSRDLANERLFPAVNIPESGTRREELLFGHETSRYQALRRALNRMKPRDAMITLQKAVVRYPSDEALLNALPSELGRD